MAASSSLAGRVRAVVEAVRPRQWPKNLLLLAIPVAYGPTILLASARDLLLGVIAFTAMSAAVYLLNDARDAGEDRAHPLKRRRPIASGRVSIRSAIAVAAVLASTSIWISTALARSFTLLLCAYFAIMVLYVLLLRTEPLLDLFAVASGFVIRAAAGAVLVDVSPSPWFIILVTGMAVFISAGRRVSELAAGGDVADASRGVLQNYSVHFLDAVVVIGAATSILALLGWLVEVAPGQPSTEFAYAAALPASYVVLRYLWFVFERAAESPERLVVGDGRLLAGIAASLLLVMFSTVS